MKKFFGLFLIVGLLFVSCVYIPNTDDSNSGNNDTTPTSYNVKIENKSGFDINIYTMSPNYDVSPKFNLKKNTYLNCSMEVSEDTMGDPVYIEYLIDVGGVKYSYWEMTSNSCVKYFLVEANKVNILTIEALQECTTNSAFLLVENTSNSDIYLANGMYVLQNAGEQINVPAKGGCSVFEIGTKSQISFGNYSQLKIVEGEKNIPFDISGYGIEKGNIYAFTFDGTDTTLKSVSPFNIDIQKKIWSFDDNNFLSHGVNEDKGYLFDNKPIIRPAADLTDGSFVMGTVKDKPANIAIINIDQYGQKNELNSHTLTLGDENTVYENQILDFAQCSDGYIFVLVRQ